MFIDPPAQRNLLPNLRTRRTGQTQLRRIGLDVHDLCPRRRRADVDHEHLVLRQFRDLGLLAVRRLDAEQATEQEVIDLELGVNGGQTAPQAEHEPDEAVGATESRVDARADPDQAAGDGKLEVVVFGEESDDAAEDGTAFDFALVVLGDEARADLDLVAELQDAGQDAAAGDAAFQVLDLGAGFVDVEGADDDHVRGGAEVADGDGDLGDEVLVDGVDVVFQLGGDGDDGGAVGDGAADEFQDRLVVLLGAFFAHQVDFVLQDDDVVELHDLDGCQMLGSLRLWTCFVAGNQEESGVHDGST